MTRKAFNVLFLCTGNSARSILAESYLNHAGRAKFQAFSAGSFPKGEVLPLSLETLRAHHIEVHDARSKSWDEFAAANAPRMDLDVTVCDRAAGEVCPIWPGVPATAHWSFPDPAAVEGSDATKRAAFAEIFVEIRHVIDRLIALPIETLDAAALKQRLAEIGPR